MTSTRRVLVHPDKDALCAAVAARFLSKSAELLSKQQAINVVLTGGTVGIGVLSAINASPDRDSIDWSRVVLWWGDERWVPDGDPDRNDQQARDALLDSVGLLDENIHTMPSSDTTDELDDGAALYSDELATEADAEQGYPRFDITFLGVGPDGHIASLFPDYPGIQVTDRTVVPVRNSPKPPPERISLTLPVINSSDRIWLVLAGADKASSIGLALAGASTLEVPVAGVLGRRKTVFFVDEAAASEVPKDLIASEY